MSGARTNPINVDRARGQFKTTVTTKASMTAIDVLTPHLMKITLSDGGYILAGTGLGLRGVLESALEQLREKEATAALARAELHGNDSSDDESESEDDEPPRVREVIVLTDDSSSEDQSEEDDSDAGSSDQLSHFLLPPPTFVDPLVAATNR